MSLVIKDRPLTEITLRRYERPGRLSTRELIRKICLCLGLLQPGDSRDSIVDVLHVLLTASKKKQGLTSDQIQQQVVESRKKAKLPLQGVAGSNIGRHLKRLKDILLVEKHAHVYRMVEYQDLDTLFQTKIKTFYLQAILERVEEYLRLCK